WVTGAADLFDAGSVERFAGRLVGVLGVVAGDPGVRVSQVGVVDAAERRRLLVEWNDTGAGGPGGRVRVLIGGRVRVVPEGVAVVCGGGHVSYAELWVRAGRLAGYLG